jgi:monofunctional biosynthetic peptidoglycan transglycosylase
MRAGGAVLEASFDRVLLRELGRGPGAGPKSLEATGLRLKRGASGQLRGSGRLLSFELASDGRMELHGFALRGREGGARGLRLGWLRVDRGAWIPPGPGPGRAFSLLADELAPDLLQLRLESKGEGPSDRLRASADLDLRNATLGSRLALEELRLGSIYPWPSPVGLGLRGATLRGSASLSAKGRRSLEAKGTATLTRLAVNHSRLAPTTVRFEDATLEGHLRWHRQGSRLALEKASISTGRAKLGLEGELSLSTRRGHGRLVLPATDCALLFASIPKELVPTLGGLRLAGALGGELSLDAQARSLDELTLTARASPNSCRVSRDAPEADVESLRRPFSFVIRPPGWAPTRLVMGPENPDWVPYIRLGRNVIGAFLAAEDRRFFEHRGFDLENIERALAADLKRRGFAKGASSISQQVAKNVFLSHKRTLARKLEEAILTWRLEQVLDKRRILEIYLNLVEMGPGIFGVRAAARRYFGKEPSRLEPLEAAHLAAITPSPRVFHERFKGGRAGMDWLLHLRYLLYQMHRLTWIDKATYERARTKDLHLASY